MSKLVHYVPASMLDFLDDTSRQTGLARSEIIRSCIMNDPRYKNYMETFWNKRPTTVVEQVTKVDEPKQKSFPLAPPHTRRYMAAFYKRDRERRMESGLWTDDDEAAYQRTYGEHKGEE